MFCENCNDAINLYRNFKKVLKLNAQKRLKKMLETKIWTTENEIETFCPE